MKRVVSRLKVIVVEPLCENFSSRLVELLPFKDNLIL